MVYTSGKGIRKNIKNKVLSFGAVFVLTAASLSGAVPLLTQKAFAAGNIEVCKTGCTYSTIQDGIDHATVGDTVTVESGTYNENVIVNRAISLVSASGAGSTKIVATNANATPLTFSTSGATVSGFTITHDYTASELTSWSTINNNGVTFGQLTSGNTLKDSTVSLNRNGVYINRSSNNVIGNTITDNRTGINATNTINGSQITGNTVSDNWTEGFVYYDSGYSTNFDTVTMTGNTFDGNWYTQVEVKTAAGSTGTLDVTNNTFTDSPVTYTTSSDASWNEPGFAAQQPVELGGTATKPATAYPTLRIYSSGSVVLKHTPKTLRVGANEPYTTIQSAVNDASAGDTIAVDAGTYSENVTVDKGLTIDGANAGINPNTGTRGSESTLNGTLTIKADNVTVDGLAVEPISGDGISADFNNPHSGETIKNNIVWANGYGIHLNDNDTTVSNNKIVYKTISGIGVETSNQSVSGFTVSGNVFSGDASNSPADITVLGNASPIAQNITISNNTSTSGTTLAALFNVKTATISGNTASNVNGSAIYIGGNDSDITVNGNNSITGSTTAVNVANDFGDGPNSDVTINGNDLSGNTTGVKVGSNAYTGGEAVDATGNWWGAANGPKDSVSGDNSITDTNAGSGSAAIGAVKYSPWCTVADCSLNSSSAPGQATNLHAKFQYDSSNVADGSYLNYTSKSGGNNLELLWSAPSGLVTGYHILATYPDGSQHTSYQGPNTNAWLATYDGFGQHGNGKYVYQVVTVNSNGTATPSSDFTLYYDNTKPTVAFTAPTPADGSYETGNFTVGYTASDNVALKSVNVSLYDTDSSHSNHWVATCYSNAAETGTSDSGTCAVHIPANTPDGKYYIQVGAQDKALNWSVNQTRTIYIDRATLAAPALISPQNNAVVKGASVTNSWGSISSAVKYEYQSFNSSNTSGTPRYDGTFSGTSKTATNVADGTVFYWRVRAIDQYGKPGSWSSPWKVTIDSTAPVAAITAPAGPYVNGTVTISGTVTDANPDHYYLVIKDSSGHVVAGPGTINSATVADYNWDTTKVADGTYTIDLEARDAAGNKDAGSTATKTITVDNTGPDTPTASPAGGTYTSTQLVSLSSSDSGSGLAGIYYTTDGSDPSDASNPNRTFISNGSSVLVSSSETIQAVAYDNAGNPSPILTAAYVIKSPVNSSLLGIGSHTNTITTAFVQGGSAGFGGGSGGAGGANGGAGGTGTTGSGHVLGASTNTPNTTNGSSNSGNSNSGDNGNVGVEGASTTKNNKKNSSAFLGLGWWWLLVILLAGLLIYGLARGTNGTDKNTSA